MRPFKLLVHRWLRAAAAHWPYYLVLIGLALLCRSFVANSGGQFTKALEALRVARESGVSARAEDYARVWLPTVGRWWFFVSLALILAGPWLIGWEKDPLVQRTDDDQPKARRWLWLVTFIMMAASAVLNAPRLFNSFWMDEESTARRFVVGDFRRGSDASPRWAEPSWERTIFYYRDPNNHPLFSILARLCHSALPTPQEPESFHFREWTIRLPAYLAGIAGLGLVAWLAAVLRMPRAGMLAVVWLAMHPWHVRYGVDARGYALLFTLLPACLGCLCRAIQTGRMNWWLGYGVLEFLVLWAYPGTLYFVASFNVAVAGLMMTSIVPRRARGQQWLRFVAANLIGAMFTTLLLGPCVEPMLNYLQYDRIRGVLDARWVAETCSGLFTGQPWVAWADHELVIAWMHTWVESPWFVVLTFGALAVVLGTGVLACWRCGVTHRWILGHSLMLGPFMYLMATAQGNILYPWYLLLCLPGLALIMGAGLEAAMVKPWGRAWIAAFMGLWAVVTWPQTNLLRSHSIEPMRESVEATRQIRNARMASLNDVLTVSLAFPAKLYDPAAIEVKTVDELRAVMDRADREHRPLFVNFADKGLLDLRSPEMSAFLDDSKFFQALPSFNGIHGQFERRVFRYVGKASP